MGDFLLSVLNDILDFSKIEANRIEIERAPFMLADIARKTGSLHALKAREKHIDFSVACEGDNGAPRLGDAHRIVQVLHNLVGNAVKFTASGEVRVRIIATNGDDVLIEVADTGIGMSPEQAARIFDPFGQAESSTSRRYGGTGLGLSIAKGLVDAMGGNIAVSSEVGAGSTFRVRLPLPLAPAEAERRAAPRPAICEAPSLSELSVLAAEDNGVNRAVLQSLIGPACRRRSHFAEDGAEAIAAFKARRFDVILMDISMPGMDGVEAMKAIRAIEAERAAAEPAPIIAVSAHAMRQQIEHYLAIGFDGYVTKPVNAGRLSAEIARVMTARKAAAA